MKAEKPQGKLLRIGILLASLIVGVILAPPLYALSALIVGVMLILILIERRGIL